MVAQHRVPPLEPELPPVTRALRVCAGLGALPHLEPVHQPSPRQLPRLVFDVERLRELIRDAAASPPDRQDPGVALGLGVRVEDDFRRARGHVLAVDVDPEAVRPARPQALGQADRAAICGPGQQGRAHHNLDICLVSSRGRLGSGGWWRHGFALAGGAVRLVAAAGIAAVLMPLGRMSKVVAAIPGALRPAGSVGRGLRLRGRGSGQHEVAAADAQVLPCPRALAEDLGAFPLHLAPLAEVVGRPLAPAELLAPEPAAGLGQAILLGRAEDDGPGVHLRDSELAPVGRRLHPQQQAAVELGA